jgi:hypothetical protein
VWVVGWVCEVSVRGERNCWYTWRLNHPTKGVINYIFFPITNALIYTARTEREYEKCTTLVGKPEEKKLLDKSRHRLKDNNKLDTEEIRYGGLDLIQTGSGLKPVACFCELSNEPTGPMKERNFLKKEATSCLAKWPLLSWVSINICIHILYRESCYIYIYIYIYITRLFT